MNNKLTFTGGEPFMTENDFLRIQQANREFIQNFLLDYGECIVSGANINIVTQGSSDLIVLNDGFVYLDGEILKVDAGTYTHTAGAAYWRYKKVTTYESGGDKTYKDGTPRQTWQKNRAVPENVTTIEAGDLDCVYGQRYNQDSNWIDVPESSLLNGYELPTTPPDTYYFQYRKLRNKKIELRFAVFPQPATDTLCFTLPEGYRPVKRIYAALGSKEAPPSTFATGMRIDTNGNIDIHYGRKYDAGSGDLLISNDFLEVVSVNIIYSLD